MRHSASMSKWLVAVHSSGQNITPPLLSKTTNIPSIVSWLSKNIVNKILKIHSATVIFVKLQFSIIGYGGVKTLRTGQNRHLFYPQNVCENNLRYAVHCKVFWISTHLTLWDAVVILKVWFSNLCYGLSSWEFLAKLLSGECHRTPLMISQRLLR